MYRKWKKYSSTFHLINSYVKERSMKYIFQKQTMIISFWYLKNMMNLILDIFSFCLYFNEYWKNTLTEWDEISIERLYLLIWLCANFTLDDFKKREKQIVNNIGRTINDNSLEDFRSFIKDSFTFLSIENTIHYFD